MPLFTPGIEDAHQSANWPEDAVQVSSKQENKNN